MAIENKLEDHVGEWVIVHNIEYGQKRTEVGKLSDVRESGIALDTFNGSFGKGCLASLSTLPFDSGKSSSIDKVYNTDCEVIYENPNRE